MSTPPDWNAAYAASAGSLFGDTPNLWLVMTLARPGFPARTALFIADGDGRNGTWAARRGLSVTAIDISAEATLQARERDRAAGVSVRRVTADLAGWSPDRSFDAVFLFYLQGPPAQREAAVRLGAWALRPGGWFVMEAFAAAGEGGCGPADPALRYAEGELSSWLEGFTREDWLFGEVRLDEGGRHQGRARVVRIAARAPGG
ncbi:class I SAM-dependent methyltransferase [Paroceanicella profunda]|uniref:Class I SAM-dependent methyltransferase n=1 Tax=Paroceanicella profunda TaxID=2579971 RepID=A0A5B8FU16_9RHOB|nr:class I SAM-dependent methyltransferase [Paroceanicella profunda]QDL91875.1 class I SAM-dependent methyltransferase [Paroceanicella profunda]